MTSLEAALINYGIHLLASRLGQNVPRPNELGDVGAAIASIDPAAEARVRDARLLLGEPSVPPADADVGMVSIFSLVGPAETASLVTVPLQRLSFEGFRDEADRPEALFERFLDEIQGIRRGLGMFESACSLLSVYAWSVTATLTFDPSRGFDPKGLSLWEQFKAVTALAHCLERQQGGTNLLLVSGDLPGIQAMLYTITSRGAAKSFRGRGFHGHLDWRGRPKSADTEMDVLAVKAARLLLIECKSGGDGIRGNDVLKLQVIGRTCGTYAEKLLVTTASKPVATSTGHFRETIRHALIAEIGVVGWEELLDLPRILQDVSGYVEIQRRIAEI